jgi:hypothetical protein
MDFEKLLAEHMRNQRLQPHAADSIKRSIKEGLLLPNAGRPGYAKVFLMEWKGSKRIPTGGKLGEQMIVWTQEGNVQCVGPDYVLQMQSVPVGGHIEMLARRDAKNVGSYGRLADYVVGKKSSEPQTNIMLIGTNELSATNPDGTPCREVRRELGFWLGVVLGEPTLLPRPKHS